MRRLFSNLSLAITILLLALWIRSHFAWDRLDSNRIRDLGADWQQRWYRFDSSSGRLDCRFFHKLSQNRAEFEFLHTNAKSLALSRRVGRNAVPNENRFLRFLGFYVEYTRAIGPDRSFLRIVLPYWFLVLLFALAPGRRIFRWVKSHKRTPPGHCAQCGYDLRATPDRCPECGAQRLAPLNPQG